MLDRVAAVVDRVDTLALAVGQLPRLVAVGALSSGAEAGDLEVADIAGVRAAAFEAVVERILARLAFIVTVEVEASVALLADIGGTGRAVLTDIRALGALAVDQPVARAALEAVSPDTVVVASQALVDGRVVVAVDAGVAIEHGHADLAFIALLAPVSAVHASIDDALLAGAHLKICGIRQVLASPAADCGHADDDDEDNENDGEDGGGEGPSRVPGAALLLRELFEASDLEFLHSSDFVNLADH